MSHDPAAVYREHAERMLLNLFAEVRNLLSDTLLPGECRVAAAEIGVVVAETMRRLACDCDEDLVEEESFESVVPQRAPKAIPFSWWGFLTRGRG